MSYTHTQRVAGIVLTASIYNADHENHINNRIPTIIDDASSLVSDMRIEADPGEQSSESQATNFSEELQRLRFTLSELKGTTYWYQSLDYRNANAIMRNRVFS